MEPPTTKASPEVDQVQHDRLDQLELENAELKAELQRYKDCLEPYCNQTQARAIEDMVKRPKLTFKEGASFTEIAMDYAKRLRAL